MCDLNKLRVPFRLPQCMIDGKPVPVDRFVSLLEAGKLERFATPDDPNGNRTARTLQHATHLELIALRERRMRAAPGHAYQH